MQVGERGSSVFIHKFNFEKDQTLGLCLQLLWSFCKHAEATENFLQFSKTGEEAI